MVEISVKNNTVNELPYHLKLDVSKLEGTILDYCAGGGGKSLALAAMSNAQITAHDQDFNRMSDIPTRAKRAGVNVTLSKKIDKNQKFDLVLCNPPFHKGFQHNKSLTEKFIKSARDHLQKTGIAFFVVNEFVGLETIGKSYFSKQEVNKLKLES